MLTFNLSLLNPESARLMSMIVEIELPWEVVTNEKVDRVYRVFLSAFPAPNRIR